MNGVLEGIAIASAVVGAAVIILSSSGPGVEEYENRVVRF